MLAHAHPGGTPLPASTTLIGNTTADIDLRYTQNGRPVGSLTIAVADRKFDRDRNEWMDGDTWFARCTVWGDLAEHAVGSIAKGTRVIAQGRITQRSYEDRDGVKRTAVEVTLDALGPDLRYATAQVTRAASTNGGGGAGYGQQQQSTSQTDAWDSRQPGGGDAWSTPGSYGDDTPF